MKTKRSFFSLFLVMALIMMAVVSCEKKTDNKSDKKEVINIDDVLDKPVDRGDDFDADSIAADKSNIEDAGSLVVDKLELMEDLDIIDVIINYTDLMDTDDPFGDDASMSEAPVMASKFMTTLDMVASMKQGVDVETVLKSMKSPADLLEEDPDAMSFNDLWNDVVGTYVWNSSTLQWDITEGGTAVIFQFPSSEMSATNDAEIKVSNYKAVDVTDPVEEDFPLDLPTALKLEVKLNGVSLLTFTYSGSFKKNGIPTAIAADLTIDDFAFEVDFINNDKQISWKYKIKHLDEIIMDIEAGVAGNFATSNIEGSFEEEIEEEAYWCDWYYDPVTQEYYDIYCDDTVEVFNVGNVIHEANVKFQLMNISVQGTMDVAGLWDDMTALDEIEGLSDEEYDSLEIDLLNKHVDIVMLYADSKLEIAKVEAYLAREYDDYWGEWDTYMDMRFVFPDGSKVNSDVYFEEGFGGLVDDLNALIIAINDDYDAGIELIQY